MAFNIYDETLKRVGEISAFVSSTWDECYADKGLCQLVVTHSAHAARLLVPGHFVGKRDKDTLWQIKTKEKRDGLLWVSGFTVNYTLLEDRIYEGVHTSGTIETDLRNAVIGQRPAPIVALDEAKGLTGNVVSEHIYPSLFELAKDLCGSADYGFRFRHDRAAKQLLFSVYEGPERSDAKFSEAFGNLENLILQQSDTDFKNVAYVGGGSSGDEERVYVTCGMTEMEGLARHEVFVDARDLRQKDGQSEADYKALLVERGLQKLNEKNQKLSVSFDVNPAEFGSAYGLGDIIYGILPEEGLKLFVRIIEFCEVIENNKTTVTITIGTPILQTIGGSK